MGPEEKRLCQAEKNWAVAMIPCTVLLALALMNVYGVAEGPGMGQIVRLYICVAASFLALAAACAGGGSGLPFAAAGAGMAAFGCGRRYGHCLGAFGSAPASFFQR